jgi:nitrogen-specific signal transduction histidine kinase
VKFAIRIAGVDSAIVVTVANDGQPVQADIAGRIFDPYVSSKSRKDNMGLGLAIVRKIIIEHGGDVTYAEVSGQPVFTISLPRAL